MEIDFLPPIAANGLSPDQLKEMVFATMSEYYLQHAI